MICRTLAFVLAASVAVPLTGCVARGNSRITNVIPVPLQEGANLVPHLAPDGRQGLVVQAREPDIGHTRLIMTMLPRAEGMRGWDVVAMDAADGSRMPTIDNRGRSLVFARAKVSGIPATLLFVTSADTADTASPGSPHRMLIRTMRLRTDETSAHFESIATETRRGRYCSFTDALAATYRLALPEDGAADSRCDPPGS